MKSNYREGSTAAKEDKELKIVKPILAAVNIILIICLFTVTLWKSNAAQTGAGFKVLSVIAWIISFSALAFEKKERNKIPEAVFYFVWIIAAGAGLFFAMCGGF